MNAKSVKLNFTGRVFFTLVCGATLAAHAVAATPRGIILVPIGTVEVQKGENGPWESVAKPTKLEPGQNVRTSDGSSANIIFSDGSKVELSPKAVFNVERTDTKEASFNLKVGKLKAYFAGIFSGRMNIRTPTAVASVRGTVFSMSAGDGGATGLDVHEGHVEIQDNKNAKAVIGAEETVTVTDKGMEQPHLVSLTDSRSQGAARPMAVRTEMAKDQTRHMIEELRNRELKSNEAQLGKSAVDAFGHRVRIEEYILRPTNNEFRFIFLSIRNNRFDWGRMIQQYANPIPDDLTLLPAIAAGAFYSPTAPTNWLKYFEVYLTNTSDAIKETIAFGNPALVPFTGFGAGSLYFPSSIAHTQILSGPGVPGGSRVQYETTLDYNISSPSNFAWKGYAIDQNGNFGADSAHLFSAFVLNPATLASGNVCATAGTCGLYDRTVINGLPGIPTTTSSFPNGAGKADYLVTTKFADGSTVSAEKFLVSNDGNILDFRNANSDSFLKLGNFNVEEQVTCSMFQGRNIDVVVAPEIFAKTKTTSQSSDTASAGGVTPH